MKGPSRSSRPASPRPRRTIEPRRYRTAAAPFSARNGRADRGKLASPKMDLSQRTGVECSGCGFEGDFVAEGFELSDVVAALGGGVDVSVVVVGAEFVEPGVGVGEQVPDDHQDRAADRDDRLLLAASSGDAVGSGRRGRCWSDRRSRRPRRARGRGSGYRDRSSRCPWSCRPRSSSRARTSPRRPDGRGWGTGSCRGRSRR